MCSVLSRNSRKLDIYAKWSHYLRIKEKYRIFRLRISPCRVNLKVKFAYQVDWSFTEWTVFRGKPCGEWNPEELEVTVLSGRKTFISPLAFLGTWARALQIRLTAESSPGLPTCVRHAHGVVRRWVTGRWGAVRGGGGLWGERGLVQHFDKRVAMRRQRERSFLSGRLWEGKLWGGDRGRTSWQKLQRGFLWLCLGIWRYLVINIHSSR